MINIFDWLIKKLGQFFGHVQLYYFSSSEHLGGIYGIDDMLSHISFSLSSKIDGNKMVLESASYVYGHITLNTPVLVRSLKLSNVELG